MSNLQTPFRYDFVGSFLRPEKLKKARRQFNEGKIDAAALKKVEDEAITELVSKIKELGYHVITDGEFRRATWHLDFMWGFDGIGHTPTKTGLPFHGEAAMVDDTYIVGKIGLTGEHPFVDHFRFVKALEDENTVAKQTIPAPAQFLEQLVKAKYNLFVCGGTNSGKTTFLNALSSFIPETERVITIEDSAELQITHVPNLVRLETRNANTEGEGEITISQLIKASLRMNPSRIIVGEVRGAEALDMLQAMNTGHPGSLSTGHGNSPQDMLSRLEVMVLMGAELPLDAIRSQIASALDIMVHLGRLKDGSRKVLSIVEIGGYKNGKVEQKPLFVYDREEKRLKKTGELKAREKLADAGD